MVAGRSVIGCTPPLADAAPHLHTSELDAEFVEVFRQAVPRVCRLRIAGPVGLIGGVHPAYIPRRHGERSFVQARLRVQQYATRKRWIVGVATEVVALKAVFFRP